VRCWSGCFAGGAAVEAGGGVVAHGRRLQTLMLPLQAVEKKGFCSSLLLRSPPLLLLRFLSPLVCFVSLLFFLSLSSKPHSPSPVCVFPGSFLFGPFSSLSVWVYWWFLLVPVLLSSIHFPFSFSFFRFVPFSLFLCYFSASLFPFFFCIFVSSLRFFLCSSLPFCWR